MKILEINPVSALKQQLLLAVTLQTGQAASFVNSRRSWKAAKENKPFSIKRFQF